MRVDFEKVEAFDEVTIRALSEMAYGIWREHYASVLGADEIEYMLGKFQSPQAVAEQIAHGYRYYFTRVDGRRIGFFAFYPREDAMYLSKWYFLKSERGKGYARSTLRFVEEATREEGLPAIELNVNRFNDTIAVYEKLGFRRVRAEKNDIGSGFFMDDYVYRLPIER